MATAASPYTWGTGRRKTAVNDVRAPLSSTEMAGRVDVFVKVSGSGKHSQSGAVLLGLARALKEFRPDLEPVLRENNFLTRDARKVERKKYGHKKARKSFQFSKR
jgi:small subunit ribosomal protein S9